MPAAFQHVADELDRVQFLRDVPKGERDIVELLSTPAYGHVGRSVDGFTETPLFARRFLGRVAHLGEGEGGHAVATYADGVRAGPLPGRATSSPNISKPN